MALDGIFGDWELWGERLDRSNPVAAPEEKTVNTLVAEYKTYLISRVAASQLSAGHVDRELRNIKIFVDLVGESLPVSKIDEDLVEKFYLHVSSHVARRKTDKKDGWSQYYARDVFQSTKGLLGYAVSKKNVAKPGNLDSFKFNVAKKKIVTFTTDEITFLIQNAPGQLKLHLLLMLNCGMTQIDVANLLDEEVDWNQGTITRKRTKTREHENVPEVTYRLWATTFTLLKQYRSGSPVVLLTAKSGKTWAGRELRNGKIVRWDSIDSNFGVLQKNLSAKGVQIDKPLKIFRKTASTMLDNSNLHSRYSTLFLGHAPDTMANAHYVDYSQDRFDDAVSWLGEQFGF